MTRIKDLRRERGETQESLAALIGITRGAYANIENGKREPDIKTMTVLANHFDVTIDQLLGLEEKEKPTPEDGGGLDGEQMEIVSLYKAAPPALRAAALAVLRSAEGQSKAPGGVSDGE